MAVAAPIAETVQSSSMTLEVFGYQANLMGIGIALIMLGILFLFYRIQKSEKLDFADMITKDGRVVSLTKILQLVGGLTATWIMIKLTLTGGITDILLGIYLSYVAGVEGYSKFVSAKYNYKETSVKDAKEAKEAKDTPSDSADDPSLKPPKA